MKRRFLLKVPCFFLLLGSLRAHGVNVRGSIVDGTNGARIPTEIIKATTRGAFANVQEVFLTPNVPLGKQTLVLSSVGDVSKEVSFTATCGETVVLSIKLAQKAVEMPDVVVEWNRKEERVL